MHSKQETSGPVGQYEQDTENNSNNLHERVCKQCLEL